MRFNLLDDAIAYQNVNILSIQKGVADDQRLIFNFQFSSLNYPYSSRCCRPSRRHTTVPLRGAIFNWSLYQDEDVVLLALGDAAADVEEFLLAVVGDEAYVALLQ